MQTQGDAGPHHIRLVLCKCPDDHLQAAMAGTDPRPNSQALMEALVAHLEEGMEAGDVCERCGAPRDHWTIEVIVSPPFATLAEAQAEILRLMRQSDAADARLRIAVEPDDRVARHWWN